jgi:hypothetical protein
MSETKFELYLADFNDKPIMRVAEYVTVEDLNTHNLHQQQVICVDQQFYPWLGYEKWIEQHGPTGVPNRKK